MNKTTSKELKPFLEQQVTSLNQLISSEAFTNFPQPIQQAFTQIKDRVNGMMAQLPPLEAHALGDQAVSVINELRWIAEHQQRIVEEFQARFAELNNQVNSMNEKVEGEITRRIEAGEMLKKETHDDLIAAAKTAAAQNAAQNAAEEKEAELRETFEAERRQAAKKAERKDALAQNGLPVPEDKILSLEDSEFEKAVEAAKTRVKTLTETRHLSPESETVKAAAWCSDDEFARMSRFIEESQTPVKPGAKPPGKEPFAAASAHNSDADSDVNFAF